VGLDRWNSFRLLPPPAEYSGGVSRWLDVLCIFGNCRGGSGQMGL
jgi:hypothetical protein